MTPNDQSLDELLIKHAEDLTDVQHIKLREALNTWIEKEIREAYKKGYIDGGIDEITRHETARKAVQKELENQDSTPPVKDNKGSE